MMKFIIASAFIFFSLLIYSQNVVRGPYLQSHSDQSIIIKWRTDNLLTSKIWYGTSPSNLNLTKIDLNAVTNHEVKLAGLSPFTVYYYAIGDSASIIEQSANFHFKTAPTPNTIQPVRTWVIGDFGKGNQQQVDVMNSYVDYTQGSHTDVWLWMGDNAYDDGDDSQYQSKVFDQYDSIFPYIPFYPTPGNHDYNSMNNYNLLFPTNHNSHTGSYYDIISAPQNGELGGLASGTEAYYSFNYANIHYVSLCSEIQNSNSRNHDMENWLHQDLAQNNQDWTIVYFHQAPYSKGSHDSDDVWEIFMKGMRKYLLPIMDQGGVDLVLSGHSHNYERSYLLKEHYGVGNTLTPNMILDASSGDPTQGDSYKKYTSSDCDYEGIVYAVMGNSGSKTGPGNDEGLNHPAMYIGDAEDAVGSLIIDIHQDTLIGTYIRSTGDIIDQFKIEKVASCDTSSINIDENDFNATLKVYSDPHTGDFKMRFDTFKTSQTSIHMYTLDGRLIYSKDFGILSSGDHYHTIASKNEGIPSGIYLFSLNTDSGRISKKVFRLDP